MKSFKLSAVAAVGLLALGVGTMQAQISRLPFQLNDVQSLNISLTGVQQATNYSNSKVSIAKTKTVKFSNSDLLGLLGQAYFGDKTVFNKSGKTNYAAQIYLEYTNTYSGDAYEYDDWYVQVVQTAGTNSTVVLDTYNASPFVPAGQTGANAEFDVEVYSGPTINGQAGNNSGSGIMTGAAYVYFDYEYYNNTNNVYNYPFNLEVNGTIKQNFSGNSKGDKYSFNINSLSGANYVATNRTYYIDTIVTGGSINGQGKD